MTLSDYLSMFASATRSMPRLQALATAILNQVVDLQSVIQEIPAAYSFSTATGTNLDAIGSFAVKARASANQTDGIYRDVLVRMLAYFGWDGTNEGLETAIIGWPWVRFEVDNCDGTVSIEPRLSIAPVPLGIRSV